jgi:cobalt-precorrin 5A hydrolase/precorrin-3B C17-methyltransferase
MLTTVVVGSSQTTMVGGRMVTPRGYTWLSQQP